MRTKLTKITQEAASKLRRWEQGLFPPHSGYKKSVPRYYTVTQDQEGWDIIEYYID